MLFMAGYCDLPFGTPKVVKRKKGKIVISMDVILVGSLCEGGVSHFYKNMVFRSHYNLPPLCIVHHLHQKQ